MKDNESSLRSAFLNDYFNSIKKHLSIAFEGTSINSFKVMPEMKPILHGYWGDGWAHTMQHQSTLLGIPSMQLEIPMSVRSKLNKEKNFRSKFSNALVNIYNECIVKQYKICEMHKGVKVNKHMIGHTKTNIFTHHDWEKWSN